MIKTIRKLNRKLNESYDYVVLQSPLIFAILAFCPRYLVFAAMIRPGMSPLAVTITYILFCTASVVHLLNKRKSWRAKIEAENLTLAVDHI